MRVRRFGEWILLFAAALALALAGGGLPLLPRARTAARLLAVAEDPPAIAAIRLTPILTPERVGAEIDAAIIAEDDDLAQSFLDLADARGVAVDLDRRARVAALWSGSTYRAARAFAAGAATGEAESAAGLAGVLAADLSGLGDVRDIAREGPACAQGEACDALVLGLATVGLATNAATLASAGAATPLRAGVTILKTARKLGRLPASLAAALTRMVRAAVDPDAVRALGRAGGRLDAAGLTAAARSAVRPEALRGLRGLGGTSTATTPRRAPGACCRSSGSPAPPGRSRGRSAWRCASARGRARRSSYSTAPPSSWAANWRRWCARSSLRSPGYSGWRCSAGDWARPWDGGCGGAPPRSAAGLCPVLSWASPRVTTNGLPRIAPTPTAPNRRASGARGHPPPMAHTDHAACPTPDPAVPPSSAVPSVGRYGPTRAGEEAGLAGGRDAGIRVVAIGGPLPDWAAPTPTPSAQDEVELVVVHGSGSRDAAGADGRRSDASGPALRLVVCDEPLADRPLDGRERATAVVRVSTTPRDRDTVALTLAACAHGGGLLIGTDAGDLRRAAGVEPGRPGRGRAIVIPAHADAGLAARVGTAVAGLTAAGCDGGRLMVQLVAEPDAAALDLAALDACAAAVLRRDADRDWVLSCAVADRTALVIVAFDRPAPVPAEPDPDAGPLPDRSP